MTTEPAQWWEYDIMHPGHFIPTPRHHFAHNFLDVKMSFFWISTIIKYVSEQFKKAITKQQKKLFLIKAI